LQFSVAERLLWLTRASVHRYRRVTGDDKPLTGDGQQGRPFEVARPT
jgi:hypothetical protein